MATLKGKWLFNEVLTLTSAFSMSTLRFTTNGEVASRMIVMTSGMQKGVKYTGTSALNVYINSQWRNEAYRTVWFGVTGQEVSDEFYTWFTANAVPISATATYKDTVLETLLHGENVTLHTEGKQMESDVVVCLPSDMVSEPVLQEKTVTVTENSIIEITPDDGYEGLSKITLTVTVATE